MIVRVRKIGGLKVCGKNQEACRTKRMDLLGNMLGRLKWSQFYQTLTRKSAGDARCPRKHTSPP